MSIRLKIELSRPYEVAAFGDFCKAVAAGAEQWEKDNPPRDVYGLLGGISRAPGVWQHVGEKQYAAEADLPEEAQAAKTETRPAEEVPTPTRKRGEPSPGKARRTKAEIAEDEAAEAAEASNIRSGAEDRVDPENADDEATQAADAADEQAEVAANTDEEAPLTIDDVKSLVVEYQEKYGFEHVQEDGVKIFREALGNPPEGEPFWKFSILPTDQPSLQKLAKIWRRAIDENPLKRKAV